MTPFLNHRHSNVSHPVWHSRVHSYRLFALLLYHQVHVVVFQDGDHLYLHGTRTRMRTTVSDASRRGLISQHMNHLLERTCLLHEMLNTSSSINR